MKARPADTEHMRLALDLARRGYGATSPNPMVGAVLVKGGKVIGGGWHHRVGEPHAEIEALQAARQHGKSSRGATLYVTLEPCSTQGRTPPCTDAIITAGIKRIVVGATDPNPRHGGKGFEILRLAGIKVSHGVLGQDCERLNEAFNHWIVQHTPFVVVKAAMTLDGKIATASGQSKWITGEEARAYAMHLRRGADAVLVGIHTILADDPSLTIRDTGFPVSFPLLGERPLQPSLAHSAPADPTAFPLSSGRAAGVRRNPTSCIQPPASSSVSPLLGESSRGEGKSSIQSPLPKTLRRIVLDAYARTPLGARIVTDSQTALTTIIVSECAPKTRVKALNDHVGVLVAPVLDAGRHARSASGTGASPRPLTGKPKSILRLDLGWILKHFGAESVTNLLVEGGGEINASFLMQGLAQRIAFFYAPKILGGRDARTAVAGNGASLLRDAVGVKEVDWLKLGADWLLTARVMPS